MVGDAKPIAFVEDTAVSPDRLPEFYGRFEAIVARHGVRAACYGHADVGCLHIRPIINVKTHEGVETLRSIAREVSDLVVEFGGSMSGEHGDGLAAASGTASSSGPRCTRRSRRSSARSTPRTASTPTRSSAPPIRAITFGSGPEYHPREPANTLLDFSGQGGFARAVEMCSGVGACRKTGTGTMCPSYMVTRDEMHSTRGRANALRLVMNGDLPAGRQRAGERDPLRGPRPLPPVQGLQERVPVPGRHGQAQGRVPAPLLRRRAAAPEPPAHGPDLPAEPGRLGPRPAGQRHAPESALQVDPREDRGHRPAADAADVRPRPLPEMVPAARGRSPSRDAAGQSSCSTTASRRTTTPRSASPRSACWRRPVTRCAWRD